MKQSLSADDGQPTNIENGRCPTTRNYTVQMDNAAIKKRYWYGAFRERPTDWFLVVFNALLALFSFGLWWSTWGLWDAAKDQTLDMRASIAAAQTSAEAAKKSADIAEKVWTTTQRAFVVSKSIAVHRVINDAGQTVSRRINVFWENVGVTPTRNMISLIRYDAFRGEMPDNFDFPDGNVEFVRLFIAPKATAEMGDLEIPISVFRAAKAGQAHIYVWGWADYNDIFDNTPRHRTEFCAEVIVLDPDAQDGATELKIYKKHNGADGETMKRPRPYPP